MHACHRITWSWFRLRCIDDEPEDRVAQVELMVLPIGEGAEVDLGILAVLQYIEGALHHGLEVVQQVVHSLKLGQDFERKCIHLPVHLYESSFGARSATFKTVDGDDFLGQQPAHRLINSGDRLEVANHVKFELDRLFCVVDQDGQQKADFVLRAFPSLASGAYTTEESLVNLCRDAKQAICLLTGQSAVDIVVQRPVDPIAHTQVVLEPHCRDDGNGLVDEGHGQ